MKTLLKNFAVFMAVILALSTFGFDVQAVAADLDQEMQTVETLQSDDEEELETEPEDPDTNPGNAEDETQEKPEAPETDPTLEADEPEETVPTESLEDQEEPIEKEEPDKDKTPEEPEKPEEQEKPEEPVEPEDTSVDSSIAAGPMVRSRVAGQPFILTTDGNEGLEPGETRFSKTAQTIPGLVNTWEITLRLEARNKLETSDIVLVIDASTSMAGNKLTQAKNAAKNFVSTLLGDVTSNVRIAIVVFGTGISNTHDFRGPGAANVNALNTFIDNISISGIQYTHTQAAIRQAQTFLQGSTATYRNIVLLSDGQPTRSYAIKQSYRNDPSWRSNYLSQQFVPNEGTRWATRDTLLEDHFDYTSTVGSGGDMFWRYDNPPGTPDDKYYNHGNHAIAQARIAKAAGNTIYTVALEAGS
ncbi:MAG: VWA domain-containing protein, partial [Eubacteriales bacterium]|nr:VWA domain-containing protein [Eubacteriales bacterium]